MATAPPDSIDRLRRCVALLQADRPLPADVRGWLADSLARVLAGDDPAAVFGVTRASRLQSRDARLRALAALADGGPTARARTVAAWLRASVAAPPAAVPLLAEVADPPEWRQILRVLRGSRSGDAVSELRGFDTQPANGVMAAWLRRPAAPAKGTR